MADAEPKAWSLTNSFMVAMGALILALLGFGFHSITGQIRDGDAAINSQLVEIKNQHKETSHQILEIIRDISVLKTNQNARLERERIEAQQKIRSGRP